MYNRLLLTLLTVSFLFIQNAYSQNLQLDLIHTTTNGDVEYSTPIPPTPLVGDQIRVHPVKSDGGYILQQEVNRGIALSYNHNNVVVDALGIQLINNNAVMGRLSVIDASTDDEGNLVLLAAAQFPIRDSRTDVIVVNENNIPIATLENIEANAFTNNSQARERLQYIVLYISRNAQGGFNTPTVFHTISTFIPPNVPPNGSTVSPITQAEFDIFTPRFIRALSSDNIQIAGLVTNVDKADFLGTPRQSAIGVNSRDIVVGHFIRVNSFLVSPPRVFRVATRLGTNQAPSTNTPSTNGLAFNNDLLGFDIDRSNDASGASYLYMRHVMGNVPLSLLGWRPVPISLPPVPSSFSIGLGTVVNRQHNHSFTVYRVGSTDASGLVGGTHSTTTLPANLITRDIHRNYRNYLVARNGRVTVLGNFNNGTPSIWFNDGNLTLPPNLGATNVLLSSWNFNNVPATRWTRIATSRTSTFGTGGLGKEPISLDTDRENNIYLVHLGGVLGSNFLPLEAVEASSDKLFLTKVNPCGSAFWTTPLEDINITTSTDRVSFGFSTSRQIYTFTNTNVLHQVKNSPIETCARELTVTNLANALVNANWLENRFGNNCSEVVTGSSSFTPPVGIGSYSATNPSNEEESFSNAVWLNITGGTDFSLTGEEEICITNDYQTTTYTIVGFDSNINYTWQLGNLNGVVSNNNGTFGVDLSSLSSGSYDLVVTATEGNCTVSREKPITITNLDFSLTGEQDICITNDYQTTTYTIVGFNSNISYTWQIGNLNGIVSNNNGTFEVDLSSLSSGVYTLVVTAEGNCTASREKSITITNLGLGLTLSGNFITCNNNSSQQYEVINPITGVTYDWLVDGVLVAPNTSIFNTDWDGFISNPVIRVEAKLGSCMFFVEQTVVLDNPLPTVILNENQAYCPNQPINYPLLVNPVAEVSYTWEILQGRNPVNLPNAIINATTSNGANAQAVINQLPAGTTTEYKVTAEFPNGCVVIESVFITISEQLNVQLDINEEIICHSDGRINITNSAYLNLNGIMTMITPSTHTGIGEYEGDGVEYENGIWYFNPQNLPSGLDYEIKYTYKEGDCQATATDVIKVIGRQRYQIQAFGCINDPSRSPNPNPNNDIVATIYPSIKNGDRLTLSIPNPIIGLPPIYLTPQPITSGGYFNFSGIPIGTVITATIVNDGIGQCDARLLNGDITTTNITVVQAPDNDIYLKDHPLDFGQQPSGERSYNSPSITITLEAPPVDADFIIPQHGQITKYYYNNTTTHQTEFNEVQDIVTTHRAQLYTNQTSYLYLRVFNRTCKDFGKGLEVDALVARAVTNWSPGDWTRLIQPVYLPKDIEAGGEVVIAIPIDYTTLGITANYHTCTMARIIRCTSVPGVTCMAETPGFDLFGGGIVESNNMTWRNINLISDAQGSSEVTILNDGLTPKMAHVKFDFAENQDPTNAHYLENNELIISLPETLAQRWQQNNYNKNNLDFINNDHKILRMPEKRNSWFEVLLMPGERFRIGLEFDIRPVTSNTPPQENVYYFDVTQYNEGELMGGVGYELLMDFIDLPPVTPSFLQAQNPSSSTIDLTWTDNSDNELVFVLERNKVGTSNYVHVANINANDTDFQDSGLEPYTLYKYRIRAISATGLLSSYAYSNQVRTLDIVQPAPSDLTVVVNSDCSVQLDWIDNASYESRYEVTRSFNGGTPVILSSNLPVNKESYIDNTSLAVGSYEYIVRVYSASGAYQAELSYTLNVDPVVPATFDAASSVASENQVDLSWDTVPSATGYKLERRVGSNWITLSTDLVTTYPDIGLSPSTSYEYRLTTLKGCVSSVVSTFSITTPFLAPTDLVATYNPTSGTIELSWTDNSSVETGYILVRTPISPAGSPVVISLGANTDEYSDASFGSSSSYTYELYAIFGSTESSRIDVTAPVPTTKRVSGYIRNRLTGDYIGNVLVELVDNNGTVLNTMTTPASGYYEFDVAANSSFTIRPSKDINKMNGVGEKDLKVYERYFLYYLERGIDAYTIAPYLAIAGDMDADCDVDYEDYELLAKAIYSTNTFSLPSWQFVPSDYDFATQGYCPYAQVRSYTNISSDLTDQDFIGIKTGDVTGNTNSLMRVRSESKEENTSYSLTLDVVPNPFSSHAQLVFGASNETRVTIRIYSSLGVEVYSREMETSKGVNTHTLQLDIAAGLYYVTIVGEQVNYTSKIVIEK